MATTSLRLLRSTCQRTMRNWLCEAGRMDTIAERLQFLRKKAGFATASEAARAFGWVVPTYLGHENGDRNPSRETAKRYGAAFKERWEWILEGGYKDNDVPREETVPIVGEVGAGARIIFEGEPQGGYDRAPKPPGSPADTVAVRVRGDSMPGTAEDNWLIYYDSRVRGMPDEWIGQLVVVWIEDDTVLVKKVFRGRDGGYLLVSTSGLAPIEAMTIEWAAKVAWIKPR